MKLEIEGVTEEVYGLWRNGVPQPSIPVLEPDDDVVINIGFESEKIKRFDYDLQGSRYIVFVKVSNDKEYNVYREHLITFIKMLILNRHNNDCQINVFIVSANNEDYKNELWSFFNMSNNYLRRDNFSEGCVIIKNVSMGYLGGKTTDFIIKCSIRIRKKLFGEQEG